MKDSNGKKGSCIFADCLVPDGSAQKCEINLASILDQMGYDCISKADFIGKENDYMELISKVENNINNGSYHELNKGQQAQTITDTYGTVNSVRKALNTLWKHDTAGKGGSKFAHGLGDGSDAYVSNNFGDSSSSDVSNGSLQDETKQENKLNMEEKTKAEEQAKEKDENKDKEENKNNEKYDKAINKVDIRRFLNYEYEKIADDYLDSEGYLSNNQKDKMLKDLSESANKKFGIDMTDSEIYDIIF